MFAAGAAQAGGFAGMCGTATPPHPSQPHTPPSNLFGNSTQHDLQRGPNLRYTVYTTLQHGIERDSLVVPPARAAPPQEGQDYLAAMACAANYAWVNRSSMTFLVRQAFQKLFGQPGR